MEHSQVLIYNDQIEEYIEIDKDISNLLREIWKLGYITYNSCQDNNKYIWIEFDLQHGKVFFEYINNYFVKNLDFFDEIEDFHIDDIKLDICFDNSKIIDDDHFEYVDNIYWSLSIRFPQHHYKYIMGALKDKYIK